MTANKSAPAKAAKPTSKSSTTDALNKKKPAKAADRPVAKPVPPKAAAVNASKPAAKPAGKAEPKGKSGRPSKAAGTDASKKPGPGEVDFTDVDTDFDGEPEVEVADEVETKAKAKPLRMKVSRAKERALMREFGLDETALTEEEVAKRRLELKTLIKMGKTRGFLTHQEINDHLPEKLVDNEILEAIVSMLNDMGIAVYEQAPDAATLLIAGGGTTTAT